MNTHIVIPGEILGKMIAHCRSGYPNEVCGILAGNNGAVRKIYTMTNAEPSPVSYMMDPGEQFRVMKEMREEGTEMLAIYHSHPQSPAYPSSKDVGLAFYPDSLYIIVGLIDPERPEIKAYLINGGRIVEIKIQIAA